MGSQRVRYDWTTNISRVYIVYQALSQMPSMYSHQFMESLKTDLLGSQSSKCHDLEEYSVQSVQSLSRVQLFATHGLKHARLSCPSPTPRACSNSCPSSQWWHPTISSSVTHFSSCLQSFPASGSFQMSQFFTSGGQSTGASALASVPQINIQDWFPLGLIGWISLQSKGLSRVFSNTTVQKHQFFGAQLSLWSNSHICT